MPEKSNEAIFSYLISRKKISMRSKDSGTIGQTRTINKIIEKRSAVYWEDFSGRELTSCVVFQIYFGSDKYTNSLRSTLWTLTQIFDERLAYNLKETYYLSGM